MARFYSSNEIPYGEGAAQNREMRRPSGKTRWLRRKWNITPLLSSAFGIRNTGVVSESLKTRVPCSENDSLPSKGSYDIAGWWAKQESQDDSKIDPEKLRYLVVGNVPLGTRLRVVSNLLGSVASVISVSYIKTPWATEHQLLVTLRSELDVMRVFQAYSETGFRVGSNVLQIFQLSAEESANLQLEQGATNCVFVGRIPYTTHIDDFRALFEPHGIIREIRWSTNSEGMFRGFAHIVFESIADAAHVVEISEEQPFWVRSQQLLLNFGLPMLPRPTELEPHYKIFFQEFEGGDEAMKQWIGPKFWGNDAVKILFLRHGHTDQSGSEPERGFVVCRNTAGAKALLAFLRQQAKKLGSPARFDFKRSWDELRDDLRKRRP